MKNKDLYTGPEGSTLRAATWDYSHGELESSTYVYQDPTGKQSVVSFDLPEETFRDTLQGAISVSREGLGSLQGHLKETVFSQDTIDFTKEQVEKISSLVLKHSSSGIAFVKDTILEALPEVKEATLRRFMLPLFVASGLLFAKQVVKVADITGSAKTQTAEILDQKSPTSNVDIYSVSTNDIDIGGEPAPSSLSDIAGPGHSVAEVAEKGIDLSLGKSEFMNVSNNFSDYLKKVGLGSLDVDRESSLGKYLRIKRWEESISLACAESKHFVGDEERVAALLMTEGYGDPYSFNSMDGGGGIGHFQPDVAERDRGMRVFTSSEKYKQYSFYSLVGKNRSELDDDVVEKITSYLPKGSKDWKKMKRGLIYTLHGKILDEIVSEPGGYDFLKQYDDRFNIDIAIPKVLEHLDWTYNVVKDDPQNATNAPGREEVKKYFGETMNFKDFAAILALNGYNKGVGGYYKNIIPHGIGGSGSNFHMENLDRNIQILWHYNGVLDNFSNNTNFDEMIDVMKDTTVTPAKYMTPHK